MIENVDAALNALESQSDELFDEVKLMLEEVRKDKAGLDSDANRAAHSGSKSQTDQDYVANPRLKYNLPRHQTIHTSHVHHHPELEFPMTFLILIVKLKSPVIHHQQMI